MKKLKFSLAIAVSAALISTSALADSWDITQNAAPGSNTTMTQDGATQNQSVQAMNAINTAPAVTTNVQGSQTATLQAHTLILDQAGTTETSTQAVNYLSTDTIGVTGTAFTQDYTGTGTVTLNQDTATLGADNLQAVNTARGVTVTELEQGGSTANTASTITLNQDTSAANTQAVNNVTASTDLTKATQVAVATGNFSLNQDGSGAQTQAVNRAVGGTNAIGTLSQTATGGSSATTMNQLGTGVSTQALNMATGEGVSATSTQTATGSLTMIQGATGAAVGNGSVQAVNYLKSIDAGVVASATQSLGSGADTISLTQHDSSTGTIQAGNLIDMTSGNASAALTAGIQNITTTDALTLAQNNTGSSLQAGNGVLTNNTGANTGGTITQGVTAGSLAMTQTSGSSSIQAANYVGITPN